MRQVRGAALFPILFAAATFPLLGSGQALAHPQRPPFASLPAHNHPIEQLHRRRDGPGGWGAITSQNWAGYDAVSGVFTSVTASWVEPSIPVSPSVETYAAFWVGLDGHGSSTVEQTGTAAFSANRSVSHYAWYEIFPDPAIPITGMTISPGDEMTGTVTSDGTGAFTLTLVDHTTNHSFTTTQTNGVTAPSSAEVIAEAPPTPASGFNFPLAYFGTVDFTNCAFNGQPINAFALDQIDMVSSIGGATEAATSGLGNDGASFSVKTIDTTPPTVTVFGVNDGAWLNHAVTVALSATDNAGGAGLASLAYGLDGVAHTAAGASTRVTLPRSPNATHTLTYNATDLTGNLSSNQSLTVHIDTVGPTTVAKPASGRKGKTIALEYRVSDNLSPRAKAVTLTVRNSHNKVVKIFRLGTEKVSARHVVEWTPKAKGVYRFAVSGKDLAGNRQTKAGSARIAVK